LLLGLFLKKWMEKLSFSRVELGVRFIFVVVEKGF
jgi:hypothetical protein